MESPIGPVEASSVKLELSDVMHCNHLQRYRLLGTCQYTEFANQFMTL